ncbi:tetratricopeptide repeat-containing sulfotransferase family protein [Candidatus Colwellia aromaticivorans]|uniref:tetratricopeptide repeat-containing sulfotransferase family protein n=1 Tax=Candidatus Colwellia aromaticivorans TaxID=2267621 RepID=UPI000DF31F11|nr:tetratricopeptide repeat-containing sulfotransferase family protein [Candidatus Colwellia aromaticivorans]
MKNNIKQLHKQAQQAINQGKYQQAHQLIISILSQDKYFADGYFLLAMIASAHHNNAKAIELIKQAIVLAPEQVEYIAQLAKHYALVNDHVQALHHANIAANLPTKSALTLDTLGVAYSQIGLHQQAVPFFKQAVAANELNGIFFFNLGASLKFTGDFSGARKAYEQTITLIPTYCKAHAALTSLGDITPTSNHIERLTKLYQQLTQSDDLLYIGHALAREYEALGDYDKAYQYLSRAKKTKLAQFNYQFSDDKNMFNALTEFFTTSEINNLNPDECNAGYDSDEPLFVVGMPRTGTTLVERILSKHSAVTSAGELQHFGLLLKELSKTSTNKVIDKETVMAAASINFNQLGKAYIDSTRAITGSTAKFVDKMPLNVLYAGFIIKALPKAKIICLDRGPLDTIVSNYRQLFAVNFSYYNYAYDLQTTAQFYQQFKQLTQLWLRLFPDNFYVVNYEKLVNNPEEEAIKIIEFCGLDWQEECLDIHKNLAPVATASAVQVRQPINNKSVGNWHKYQGQLTEVIRYLTEQGLL